MNRFVLRTDDAEFQTTGGPTDLSIPLRFDGPQPGFFGADEATARPMHSGDFIGDTRLGGSCNAEHVDLIPHCNGTHTECLGHITNERIAINRLATGALYLAAMITIDPVEARYAREQTGTHAHKTDRLITRSGLEESEVANLLSATDALIVRTIPNDPAKTHRNWVADQTPYFSVDAMRWIVQNDINHLLVDTPTIDRMDDGGLLAHRIFWGMATGSHSARDATRPEATITELIYAPDELPDGLYLLDLQIAPFVSDAAPSRPLLYRIAQ